MDEFDVDYLKFKKSTAMSRFRRLFRFAELFATVVLLAWLSARAPTAVKASSDYFCRLCSAIASPIFVFFLGNAIVVALFAKSGHLSRGNAESEICEELSSNVPAMAAEEEIVFQDKQVIVCEEVVKRAVVSDSELLYRRSKSEKVEKCEEQILRRSKTETESEVGDGMSSEEFRRTIEEFIAKQVKSLREESHSVVVEF